MKRLLRALARAFAESAEFQERLLLLDRPWEEEFLHWVGDGEDRVLHGFLVPPEDGRRRSVTRAGWCPAQIGRSRTA